MTGPQFTDLSRAEHRGSSNPSHESSVFFPFVFEDRLPLLSRAIGVRRNLDGVRIHGDWVTVTFGLLNTTFDLRWVGSVDVIDPAKRPQLGPRVARRNSALTIATGGCKLVRVVFRSPIDPVLGRRKHPQIALTVVRPDGLRSALSRRIEAGQP